MVTIGGTISSSSSPLLLSPLFYTSWGHCGPPFILLDSHCHVFYDWMWRPPLARFSAQAILWQCFNTSAFHVSTSTTMEMQNCICTISLDVGSSAKYFYYYGPRVPALLYMAKTTNTAGASLWSVSVFCLCFDVQSLCVRYYNVRMRESRIGKTIRLIIQGSCVRSNL